jgi:hypothetical protein
MSGDDQERVSIPREHLDAMLSLIGDGHEHDRHVWTAGERAGRREVIHNLTAEARAEKATQHELLEALRAAEPAERWRVRGEQRTRQTFGQPHPRDFPGRERERQAEEREAG